MAESDVMQAETPARRAQKMAAETKAPRPALPIANSRVRAMFSSETTFGNIFAAVTETGTPWERVLEPDYWANVAGSHFVNTQSGRTDLLVNSTIKVFCDDGSYYGELLIRALPREPGQLPKLAIVEEILHKRLGPVDTRFAAATYEVMFRGPHLRWCVVHRLTGEVIASGLATQEEAEGRLRRTPVAA